MRKSRPCKHGHNERYAGGHCKECRKEKQRASYARNVMHVRTRRGLPTPTRAPPAVCECCGNPPGKKALALDHCHVTDKFRGWLCAKCNVGMGMLGDSLAGLALAASYLKRNG